MASRLPAHFIGMGNRLGEIRPGLQADLVLVTEGQEVVETWIRGQADAI
jgi:N-acetylglucosamine-6-phosphate deacetylase